MRKLDAENQFSDMTISVKTKPIAATL